MADMACEVLGHKGPHQDVRLIEDRIRWGAAVRRGIGTGYSGRPYPACMTCRYRLKKVLHRVWKYHKYGS